MRGRQRWRLQLSQLPSSPRLHHRLFLSSFGYDSKDEFGTHQYRNEVSDSANQKRGNYGYKDAGGVFRQVDYVADAAGFRANVYTNEPGTAPSEPAAAAYTAPAAAPVAAAPVAVARPALPAAPVVAAAPLRPVVRPAPVAFPAPPPAPLRHTLHTRLLLQRKSFTLSRPLCQRHQVAPAPAPLLPAPVHYGVRPPVALTAPGPAPLAVAHAPYVHYY
ncbi:hypothetical protein HPB52_013989 [Rhipicephalus sanguineus]|uniref:Cuticle protein n=1 Tax=Rhipicephalus sanguineus TaxID=34632 RepID=A0A9D4Q090_RHISA|nr:hypothetical protein HPB52_013989 [Rhipicephalus sanguineus]